MSGIPEGASQVISGSSIPFECDFDLLNGIDYNKGCYLGQELVARTHYRGAVRKRLFPLVSLGPSDKLQLSSKMSNFDLISTLLTSDLATEDYVLVPPAMMQPIPTPSSPYSGTGSGSALKKVHATMELKSLYDVTNEFPTEGAPIIPIQSQSDLEAVLGGKSLSVPAGVSSSGRVSKVMGGSSWHVGMGLMRTDAWHSSPALLFWVPSSSDASSGTLLKGTKPWWYENYVQWRQEAEAKAQSQAAEDL